MRDRTFNALSERSSKESNVFINSANRGAPGTIHHQKKNTANFSSPSEF